jgi:hypothetical protein
MARTDKDVAFNVPEKVCRNPDELATWIHKTAIKIFRRDRRKSAGFTGGQSRFELPAGVLVFARPDEREAVYIIENRLEGQVEEVLHPRPKFPDVSIAYL